jgi:hypothetical protein
LQSIITEKVVILAHNCLVKSTPRRGALWCSLPPQLSALSLTPRRRCRRPSRLPRVSNFGLCSTCYFSYESCFFFVNLRNAWHIPIRHRGTTRGFTTCFMYQIAPEIQTHVRVHPILQLVVPKCIRKTTCCIVGAINSFYNEIEVDVRFL